MNHPAIDRLKDSDPEAYQLVSDLFCTIQFYSDPENYHAIGFFPDPPCGDFIQDFSDDHGHPFYDRPMPGKMARETLLKYLGGWYFDE